LPWIIDLIANLDCFAPKKMDTKLRYYLSNKVGGEVLIFDAETGQFQRPACWQDISAYYHYLEGRGRIGEAQQLLAESLAGNKPITKMLTSIGISNPKDLRMEG
jgi:hypothetical protein